MRNKSIIEYLDPQTAEKELSDFELLAPALLRQPGFIKDYLRSPGIQSATVKIGGVPAYVIAFRVTTDHGFWLEVIQSKRVNNKPEVHLMPFVNDLAKQLGCTYIRGSTSKFAVIKLMERCGFVPEAILMTKAV